MQAFDRIVSIVRCGALWQAIQYTYTGYIYSILYSPMPIEKDYGLWNIDRFNCLELCGFSVIIHSWVEHRAQPKH